MDKFLFPSQRYRTIFYIIIQLTLLASTSSNPLDRITESNVVAKGQNSLDAAVSHAEAVDRELGKVKARGMTLDICRDVVNKSLKKLSFVQKAIGSASLSDDHATSAQQAISASGTYLKTCQMALDEAGESTHGPFGSVMPLLANAGKENCNCTKVVTQAIVRIASRSSLMTVNDDAVKKAVPTNVLQSVPAERRFKVAKDGSGDFTTITDAVKKVPIYQSKYYLIYIAAGTYKESVVITSDRPYIILVGAGEGKTILTGDRSNRTGFGTYYSSTLAVESENFIGVDLTIENTAGPSNYQAVALRTTGSFSVYHRCTILGYQDTLFAHMGQQFFYECTIAGTIDFIFGDASVVFQKCTIQVRNPLPGQQNVIAASSRSCTSQLTGISIHMSKIVASPDLKSGTKTYLGRPWGKNARTAFIKSDFSVPIDPERWAPMNANAAAADVDFGEFGNTGLSAGTMSGKSGFGDRMLDQTSAQQFTVEKMLNGGKWIDQIAIPHTKGLQ